jgi:hypothetical protein
MSKVTTARRSLTKPRKVVYVIGAGFSFSLGYPLVNDLLIRLWPSLSRPLRTELEKVVLFHHPGFLHNRATSFPNVETLLSEMMANDQLFDASRSAPTGFTLKDLQEIREEVLYQIAVWFHRIYSITSASHPAWLNRFRTTVIQSNATVISFNWDLVVDHLLFGNTVSPTNYGVGSIAHTGPVLLKPHGSLNWFDEKLGQKINKGRRVLLHQDGNEMVYAFTKFRAPKSKIRKYVPLIIPPVFNKSFERKIFAPIWQNCVAEIGSASHVIFLGYSLPDADLHARFIFRCGFYNQVKGAPIPSGRAKPTGASAITVVNPDLAAARRIEGITSGGRFNWEPLTVERWL